MTKNIFIAYLPIDNKIRNISVLNPKIGGGISCLQYTFESEPFRLHYFTYTKEQGKTILRAEPGHYENMIKEILTVLFESADQFDSANKLVLLHSGDPERLTVRKNDLSTYSDHQTFSGGNEVGHRLIDVAGRFLPGHENLTTENLAQALGEIWHKYQVSDYSTAFFQEL